MGLLPFEKKKREVIIKKNFKTSEKFGKSPEERTIPELLQSGIINIDKPKGPTSHEVSSYVQKILGVKAGHSGTLDPAVTGVLPIGIGKGTKVNQYLLNAGKEYVCLMHVHKDVPEAELKNVIMSFVGRIKQLPPLKSAVKRIERYRTIYYIDILEISRTDVLFKVGCQAGTYIRKLCTDIGEKLGTGAHMQELRRTKSGAFNEDTLVTLQDVADAFWYYKNENNEKYLRKVVMPMEKGVEHLPKIWIMDSAIEAICHGSSLKVPGIVKLETEIQKGEEVAVMSMKDELVMIGTALMTSKEMLEKEKGIAVKPQRVLMNSGVYPKIEKVD